MQEPGFHDELFHGTNFAWLDEHGLLNLSRGRE